MTTQSNQTLETKNNQDCDLSCCNSTTCSYCPSPCLKFIKAHPDAVLPEKGTSFSVGCDLTCISVFSKISEKTTLYDTGLKVIPPSGYYTEIIPRSSLVKTGYILSNSVGIIDPDYTGNLLIALTRVDDSIPELILPFKRCQLVLRKVEDFNVCIEEIVPVTGRGEGGFGSTDK